jgi:hypothetical protein
VNDSKTKTTRRNYGDTAKTRTKATAKAQGTTPKTPPKATKKPKPSAKELKAARNLLASYNPIGEAAEVLKAAGCTGVLIAGDTKLGNHFCTLDPMHRVTRGMARKAMREDAERQKAPRNLRDTGSLV